ncbi:MAG: hypothetical protein CSH36_04045 [Thalassolituus sp.]|jgi:uncharacterized membrane protein|uniref:energy-coupling factor ABC transporter permease n=1 Tax=Thalassolituus sp. TaxID=2030822 RepID=UPI003511C62F|nr:MAG: hypothetical protein CSH36_04045 [Thalassolituus sp.]
MLFLGNQPFLGLIASVAAIGLLIYVISTINWQALRRRPGTHHFFAGAVLIVTGLWLMHAGIKPGLHFHILGVTGMTLLMGWRLAILACGFILTGVYLLGKVSLEDLGVSLLFGCALPVFITWQFYLQVYRRMAHNPFVYILVAGFLNAGITQAAYALILSGWYVHMGLWDLNTVWEDLLRYLPLMMFPEGVINGMFIAGMVSFHPRWLSTFDQDSYFGQS